jgi:iron complex outermembrane receptor protein
MIRASFEHGFRAPNLAAIGTPMRSGVGPASDTYYSGIKGVGAADGNAQRYSTTGVDSQLGPERSESGTFGVVVDVPWVDGLSFSADYWKIHQVDLIATPSSSIVTAAENAGLVNATKTLQAAGNSLASITPQMLASQLGYSGCFANPLTGAQTYISYHDAGTGATVWRTCAVDPQTSSAAVAAGRAAAGSLYNTFLPYANLASATIDGVDLNITYRSPMFDIGRFQVVSDATWLDKYQRRATATSPLEHDVARNGAARWHANLNVLWYYQSWNAGLAAYYIGDYASTTQLPTTIPLSAVPHNTVYTIDGVNYWKIASSVTENAFVQYTTAPELKYLGETTLRLGVDNLTNRAPPFAPGGYDPSVYSAIAMGRVWSLSVSKKF